VCMCVCMCVCVCVHVCMLVCVCVFAYLRVTFVRVRVCPQLPEHAAHASPVGQVLICLRIFVFVCVCVLCVCVYVCVHFFVCVPIC